VTDKQDKVIDLEHLKKCAADLPLDIVQATFVYAGHDVPYESELANEQSLQNVMDILNATPQVLSVLEQTLRDLMEGEKQALEHAIIVAGERLNELVPNEDNLERLRISSKFTNAIMALSHICDFTRGPDADQCMVCGAFSLLAPIDYPTASGVTAAISQAYRLGSDRK
jgi:hypothetical protein